QRQAESSSLSCGPIVHFQLLAHLLLQERSYFQLMDSDQPMKGLAPFQSNALTGALAQSLRRLRFHSGNMVL
ncbi:MAG: hypothetical protein WCO86_15075, partial [Planctomycetota bacterium]